MKKIIYLSAAMAMIFSGCSDNDDNGGKNGSDETRTISLKASQIKDVPSNVSEIRAVNYEDDKSLVTASWNDGFELVLPETLPAGSLQSLENVVSPTSEVTISNKDAKAMNVYLAAYDKDGREIIPLLQNKITSEEQYIMVDYMYFDSDCTIKGTDTYDDLDGKRTVKYDCSFKKGWNKMESRYIEYDDDSWENVFTTSLSSGLSWGFINW